jgi:uncharacterized protein YlxW (UPF0749 family)
MSAEKVEPESAYLRTLVVELREIQAEVARLNRRFRNARNAIREVEENVMRVADEAAARAEQVRRRGGGH